MRRCTGMLAWAAAADLKPVAMHTIRYVRDLYLTCSVVHSLYQRVRLTNVNSHFFFK